MCTRTPTRRSAVTPSLHLRAFSVRGLMSIHQLRTTTGPCLLHVRGKNRLLSLLPAQDYEHVRPLLEEVSFDARVGLFKSDEPLLHVYFPLTAVASLVLTMDDGDGVE